MSHSAALSAGEVVFLRLYFGHRALDLALGNGGEAVLATSTKTGTRTDDVSLGVIAPDAATSITIDIDLSAGRIHGALGSAAPTDVALPISGGTFTGILVGLWSATAKTGTFWLDDIALE